MAVNNAVVKAVQSGDTLVLIGRSTGGPPPELQLTLSSLQAPKLARGSGTVDEPFAWDSREFLRTMCIGQPVTFKIEYKVASIGRTFGTVMMGDQNLGLAVVREGWAKVKSSEQSRDGQSEDYEELVRLEQAAQAGKKGLWGSDAGKIRKVTWTVGPAEAEPILNRHKGSPVKVIVEHVFGGSSMRALLVESMTMINFHLAGVSCPRVNPAPRKPANGAAPPAAEANGKGAEDTDGADSDDGADATNGKDSPAPGALSIAQVAAAAKVAPANAQPEPFAQEAKYFTEVRLLHREVDVLLQGLDSYGTFFGTVLHPKGNVSVEILKNGLGKMVDWSSALVPRDTVMAMRSAENEAKRAQVKLWAGWTAPQIQGPGEFTGTVIEVHSGDQITVLVQAQEGGPKDERRVALASIRAPRMGNPRKAVEDEPWAAEARESLRNKAIGRPAKVIVEYQRDMPIGEKGETQRRAFATVLVGKAGKAKNISEALLSEGLCTVIKHRQDEPRSSHYDDMVAAEQAARNAKKGQHSSAGPPASRRILDLTSDNRRAKEFFRTFSKNVTHRAVVEHVFTGHRIKAFLPKESCSFMFALSTVRCPAVGRAPEPGAPGRSAPGEPFGDEARRFTREQLMQRGVEIEVGDVDKNGIALGNLYVGQGEARHSYALDLLRAGMGKLDGRAMERMNGAQAFVAAQDEARAGKRGLWSVEEEVDKKEEILEESGEMQPVRLCDMVDGGRFFVHMSDDAGLQQVEERMRAFTQQVGTAGGATMETRRGTLCAALFNDPDSGLQWYRARIENSGPRGVDVVYIDHGNRALLQAKQLRPLDKSYFLTKPQARECVLAYMRVPTLSEEYGRDAAMELNDSAWGKPLLMRTYGRDDRGVLSVALHLADEALSINESLVRQGLARIPKSAVRAAQTPAAKQFVEKLKEAQEVAHKSRANMWRYGDCASDDEDGH